MHPAVGAVLPALGASPFVGVFFLQLSPSAGAATTHHRHLHPCAPECDVPMTIQNVAVTGYEVALIFIKKI